MATVIDTDRFTQDQLLVSRANDYCRWISSLYDADSVEFAAKYFALRWPRSAHLHLIQKAASNYGTTTEPAWAAPLASLRPLEEAFVELSRPASILGKLDALVQMIRMAKGE